MFFFFFFFFFFHNLEPKMQGLLILRGIYIKKDQREFLCAKIYKISNVIKNVICKCTKQSSLAIIFSNSFTYNQAEQIKKGVICVQILLYIHLTEHGRFHFQGRTTFYTPVLGHTKQAHDVKMTLMRRNDIT